MVSDLPSSRAGSALPDFGTSAADTVASAIDEPRAGSLPDAIVLLAHDMRTPLTTINVACELLAATADRGSDRAAEHLVLIRDSVARIEGMLDEMLDRACPSTGRDRPAHSVAAAVLNDVAHDHSRLAALNDVALDVRLPGPACLVPMEHATLRQVLANLVTNAIRFTAPGGKVWVVAEPLGAKIRFAVADTGRGIAENDLPHVFDRDWHQQQRAGTRAGLGLSLVKSIVEAHGGRVGAASRAGVGSIFMVTLPVARPRGVG